VTHDSWENQVTRRILIPLGLRHTYAPGASTRLPAPHATGYLIFDKNTRIDTSTTRCWPPNTTSSTTSCATADTDPAHLEDLAPDRAEVDAHRPYAQPLVRGHPLGFLAVGHDRPGPVGEVAQHRTAGLAGVRLDHAAGRAVVAVPVEVM